METLLHQPIVTAALALLGLVCLGHLAYCTLRSALMGLALAGLAALLASQSGAWVHVSGAFRRWLFSLLLLGGFDQASAVEIGVQAHPRPFGFDASSPAAEKTMDSLLDRMAPFVSQPMSWCAVKPTGYNVTRPIRGRRYAGYQRFNVELAIVCDNHAFLDALGDVFGFAYAYDSQRG